MALILNGCFKALMTFDDIEFLISFKNIYPKELDLKVESQGTHVSFLDLFHFHFFLFYSRKSCKTLTYIYTNTLTHKCTHMHAYAYICVYTVYSYACVHIYINI